MALGSVEAMCSKLSLNRGVAQFAVQTGFTGGVYGDQRDLLIVPEVSRPERAWEIRSDGLNHRSRPVAVAPPVDPGCGSNLGHPAETIYKQVRRLERFAVRAFLLAVLLSVPSYPYRGDT